MGGGGGGGVHPLYPPTRSNPALLRRSPRVSPCLSILLLTATSIRRTPRLEGHPELVPAFLYSLKLTLYKMDISLSRTHCASTKDVHLRGRVDCSDNIPLSCYISLCQWIQIIVKVFQRSGRLVSTNTVYRVSSMEKKWTGCLEYWVRHINSKLLLCLLNPLKSDQHQFFPNNISSYRVARNFCGSLFSRIGDCLCFAGTNFCD